MRNDSQIIITSWNVRGLGKLSKVKQVMHRLKQFKTTIVFLQETHLLSSEEITDGLDRYLHHHTHLMQE